jgi:hypothetical protein
MLSGLAVIDAKKILKFRVRCAGGCRISSVTSFFKILGDTLAVSDQLTFFTEEFSR